MTIQLASAKLAPILVTPKEAADALSMSLQTVYLLLDRGELQGRYRNKRRFVLYTSLVEYAEGLPSVPEAS